MSTVDGGADTGAPAPGRPARALLLRTRWMAPSLVVFALLRLPSFIEPHWYTDEGGYAATSRSLLNGKVLYSQIWNNKPPLHLWTIALDVRVFGGSEAGLHALTFLSGLIALAALAYVAVPVLGRRRAAGALLLAAILLGAPIFDAELALPESLLIAPATWAGAIVLRRAWTAPSPGGRWRPVVAGGCAAAAIAYQQTAVADAAAFFFIMLVSPRVSWRQCTLFAATVVAATTAWVSAALITAGPHAVAFALVGFYIPWSQSVLPASHGSLIALLATLCGSLVLLCAGAHAARRSTTFLWGAWVWAGADLLVAGAAQQPYAHFLTAAIVPVTLALFSIRLTGFRAAAPALRVGAAALLAGLVMAGSVAKVAGVDWIPQWSTAGTNTGPRDLAMYYGGALRVLAGQDALEDLQNLFDFRVASDRATAAWVRAHGLSGRSAVLWSSDAWLYVLADLPVSMPTPPIYNDEVLLGNQGQVADRVAALAPDIVITATDALAHFPELKPLLASRYRAVDDEQIDMVWVRDDIDLAGSS